MRLYGTVKKVGGFKWNGERQGETVVLTVKDDDTESNVQVKFSSTLDEAVFSAAKAATEGERYEFFIVRCDAAKNTNRYGKPFVDLVGHALTPLAVPSVVGSSNGNG